MSEGKEMKFKRKWFFDSSLKSSDSSLCFNKFSKYDSCNFVEMKIKRCFNTTQFDVKDQKLNFWKPVLDSVSGRIYYWNWKTMETSWVAPISTESKISYNIIDDLNANRLFMKKKFDQAIEYNIETCKM